MNMIEVFEILVDLTKKNKIKSFQVELKDKNEIIIDFLYKKNIDTNNISKIKVSTKVIKNLNRLNIDKKEELINFLELNSLYNSKTKKETEFFIKNKNKRNLYFDLKKHSKIQFVKRFILFANLYYEDLSYSQKKEATEIIKSYEDLENIENNKKLDELIINYIEKSKTLNKNSLYRKKDIKHYNKRNNEYDNTIRVFTHPFIFIFSDNVLKTVELYSSSFKVDILNFNTNKRNFVNENYKLLKEKINFNV